MHHPDLPWPLLQNVAALAESPLSEIAKRLREAVLPYYRSSALVIFTEDCTGRPQKKAGEEDIISRVSIAELDALRASLPDEAPWFGKPSSPAVHAPYSPLNTLPVTLSSC